MHVVHTIVEARCLELEAELSNLCDKSRNDNPDELVNHFSNLEVDHLNLQLKYQNLKDTFENNPPTPDKDTPDFDSVFVIGKMQASLQGKDNVIRQLKKQISYLQETRSDTNRTLKVRAVDSQITQLIEKVTVLHAQNDVFRAENDKIKQHYKKLNDHFGAIMGYGDYVIGDSVISKHSCYVRDTDGVELIKGSRGSNLYTISVEDMMKSSPIYLLSKASKNKSWLWHWNLNHLNFGTINDLARKDLIQGLPRLKFEKDHLCSACQQGEIKKHTHKPNTTNTNLEVLNTLHMDLCGPMRVQTINRKKYILVIIDDYSRFTWVKFFRSKDETPETVPRTPQQNDVVERRNRTLVEAARMMLIFSKALMFLWAEAVATACYTQNRSLIQTRHNKTPYELLHNKKPDLTFFRVFGALCYPTNDSKDLGKLQPIVDIGIFVGYAPSRKGPAPIFLTPEKISSGLVPNPVLATPYVPPTNKDLEILFQPMFDEYLEPARAERLVSPTPAVQASVNSADTPSSTTINQDAPSPSISPSSSALQSYQGIAAESTFIEDNPIAPVDNNPFINVFAPESSSDASSSGD
nr:hypothetical protein [Tanacetum cinerariifolium]